MGTINVEEEYWRNNIHVTPVVFNQFMHNPTCVEKRGNRATVKEADEADGDSVSSLFF